MTIIDLAEKANNSKMQTMQQVVEKLAATDSMPDYKDGLVIMLNRKDGAYDVSYQNAGLSASEGIALLETVKIMLLKDMGYLND